MTRKTAWIAICSTLALGIACSSQTITNSHGNGSDGGSSDDTGGKSSSGGKATGGSSNSASSSLGGKSSSATTSSNVGGTAGAATTASVGSTTGVAGTTAAATTVGGQNSAAGATHVAVAGNGAGNVVAAAGNTSTGGTSNPVTGAAGQPVTSSTHAGAPGIAGAATTSTTGGANTGGLTSTGGVNTGGIGTGGIGTGGIGTGGVGTAGVPNSSGVAGAPYVGPPACTNATSGCPDCCASLAVPAGSFPLGRGAVTTDSDYYPYFSHATSDYYNDELPEHSANLSAFVLDKYEVTVARFREFVKDYDAWRAAGNPKAGAGARAPNSNTGWQESWTATGAELPATASALRSALVCDQPAAYEYPNWSDNALGKERAAINCVTWYEAFAFCIWDGGRLPTEAEWEYAAAGGGGVSGNRLYPWGPDAPTANHANCWDSFGSSGASLAVGSATSGAARWGHQDLAGSMFEWALDWYSGTYYTNFSSSFSCDDCVNLTPSASNMRIIRGGSWYNYCDDDTRAAYREVAEPVERVATIGFRCARAAAR